MLPQEFWNTYAGGFKPLDFMRLFNSHDPAACAWAYVKERPALYGIVRRGSWRETFAAERQHTRFASNRRTCCFHPIVTRACRFLAAVI